MKYIKAFLPLFLFSEITFIIVSYFISDESHPFLRTLLYSNILTFGIIGFLSLGGFCISYAVIKLSK